MNAYNIYKEEEPSTILYHAFAKSVEQVEELAATAGIDIADMTIDLERKNVKDALGRGLKPSIKEALIH